MNLLRDTIDLPCSVVTVITRRESDGTYSGTVSTRPSGQSQPTTVARCRRCRDWTDARREHTRRVSAVHDNPEHYRA